MGLQQSFLMHKGHRYPHYYLCNYLPVSAGPDRISYSLLKFKQGRQPDLSAWLDCSVEILGGSPPSVIAPGYSQSYPHDQPVVPPGAILVRALHHQETTVAEGKLTSLDRLGSALAVHFQCFYHPGLLCKSQNAREMKGLSQNQREQELKGLYYLDAVYYTTIITPIIMESPHFIKESPHFLVIDDIFTTGTTVKMIIGALTSYFPLSTVCIFTLAKADYDANLNKTTRLSGKHYRMDEGMDWSVAEEDLPYYSYCELMAWIKKGKF